MIKETNELVLTINNCCWCLDNNWCDRMFITRVVNIMSIYIILNFILSIQLPLEYFGLCTLISIERTYDQQP